MKKLSLNHNIPPDSDFKTVFLHSFHHHRNRIHEYKQKLPPKHLKISEACVITAISFIVLISVIVTFLSLAYRDRILPGVQLAGQAIDGVAYNDEQIEQQIDNQLDKIHIKLTYDSKETHPSLIDLGITVNREQTIKDLYRAKTSENIFTKYNPLAVNNVPLSFNIDAERFQDYLNNAFPTSLIKMQETSAIYDEGTQNFVIKPGTNGSGVSAKKILENSTFLSLSSDPREVSIDAETSEITPYLTESDFKPAIDQANAKIHKKFSFISGTQTLYELGPEEISNLLNFQIDAINHRVELSVDRDHVVQLINEELAPTINTSPINRRIYVDGSGNEQYELRRGVNGRHLENTEQLIDQVYDALINTTDLSAKLDLKILNFSTDRTTIDSSKWIEANLSNYCVYLHQGADNAVIWSTCATADGKPSTPTITGEFRVYSKVGNQCMPNPPSPTPLCNIRYVTYWGPGGYAFHEAWWLTDAKVHTGISHGCINMYANDALQVYNFAEIGMRVWVHY